MSLYRIKAFSDIDFLKVDLLNNSFEMSDVECNNFSDEMCDYYCMLGTVLESLCTMRNYQCVLCHEKLTLQELVNGFIDHKGYIIKFIIPQSWLRKERKKW